MPSADAATLHGMEVRGCAERIAATFGAYGAESPGHVAAICALVERVARAECARLRGEAREHLRLMVGAADDWREDFPQILADAKAFLVRTSKGEAGPTEREGASMEEVRRCQG